MLLTLSGKYNSRTVDTTNLQMMDFDDEEMVTIIIPSEIAIEVSGYYYEEDEDTVWDSNDIRNDIGQYFDELIEGILEETIDIVQSYGNKVV